MTTPTTAELQKAMRELDLAVQEFRSATGLNDLKLDGHTVGLVGELIAQIELGVTPNQDKSTEGFDGTVNSGDGQVLKLEVKATQTDRGVAFRGETPVCDSVVVYQLNFEKGQWTQIYYGPSEPLWKKLPRPASSNNQRTISFTRLKELQSQGWSPVV